MIIILTEQQQEWCKELALKRSGSMNHAETKNSINCFKEKPGWHRHFIGALGELAYAIHTGKEVDTTTIGRGDTGTDFDNGVDVKSSASKYKPPLLLFVNQFARKTCETYVLAWVNLPQVELIGSIKRDKIMDVQVIKNYGYGDSYYIDNKFLTKII